MESTEHGYTAHALYIALLNAADDYEADTIEALAIAIGYRWRCACGWVNTADATVCDGCAADHDPDNYPCQKCRRTDLPLHGNYQCPECYTPAEEDT